MEGISMSNIPESLAAMNALPDISQNDSERLREFMRVTALEIKAVGGVGAATSLELIGYIRELESTNTALCEQLAHLQSKTHYLVCGARIEALEGQLAQVTQERDALQEQLKAAFRELLNEQDSNRNFRKAAVALCKRSASNWRTTGGRSQGDYARACREKANLITEIATALEQLQCKTESNHEPQ